MEQQGPMENSGMSAGPEAAAIRPDWEAVRRDYEVLVNDVKSFWQAVRDANYGQKALDMSKEQVRKQPLATVAGAFVLGMMMGKMSRRR